VAGSHLAETTERIRQASDIADVVSAYVNLKRAGRGLRGLCPFHSEKTPSFHVLPERQTFRCFGCGAAGDVFKFIQLRENVGFAEARAILAHRAGIDLDQDRPLVAGKTQINKTELERVNRWAMNWFRGQLASPAGQRARDYIAARGIESVSVERFGLGFAPDGWEALVASARKEAIAPQLIMATGLAKQREDGGLYDAFRNRLMFPIRDTLGRVLGFGGRTLGEDQAKYINSPQSALFDKSRTLYGLDLAKDAFRQRRAALVVEGYVDCIMAHQHGFGQTVATLGTALTAEHAQMLSRYVDELTLLFDADAAGQRAADQTLPLLLGCPLDVRLAQVPEGKDPADLLQSQGRSGLEQALTSSVAALEFKWHQVRRRYESGAAGPDRRRAVEEFLRLLVQSNGLGSCDPIQRGLIINRVGKLLGLSAEEVNRQVRIIARQARPAARALTTAAPSARPQKVADAAAAAMQDLIEVLLNEPSHYAAVSDSFDPDSCQDQELAAIARAIAALAAQQGSFSLPELISRFDSVQTARRIMELQQSGECAGNYQVRIELALARLAQVRERNRISATWALYRAVDPGGPASRSAAGPPDADDVARESDLGVTQEAARRMSQFAARRHRSAPLIVGVQTAGPQHAG